MKVRTFTLLLAIVMITTLALAGSVSADPPKQDFHCKWGDFLDGQGCPEFRETGNAAHCPDQRYKVQLFDCTNPLVSGTLEFWFDVDNLAQPDGSGWYWHEQFKGGFRIQPQDIDGYWEGGLASVNGQWGWYEPISTMQGRGYGDLSGYLIKGAHWWEPGDGPTPYGDSWPVNSGEIIETGAKD